MNEEHDSPETDTGRDLERTPSDSIADLATELVELARNDPESLKTRVADLEVRQQAELALRLPAKDRLELLLHAPRPMRLVRSLPDADFYLTVREIGPTDALAVIALASNEQLQHLLDLESWRKDRFDGQRCGAWIALLLESGEPTVRRFLRHADDDLLALVLRDWIGVEQMEYEDSADIHGHGQNESGFVTPDGEHRFTPTIVEHAPAIRAFLQIFFQEDRDRYQQALWAARWELPGELEESGLRWRTSRLEEHGFPGWEDALSVYAPAAGNRVHPDPPVPADRDGLPSARSLLPLLAGHGPIAAAIDGLEGEPRERVLHGLISVANHLMVADGADSGDPESHRHALLKAGNYVRIALALRGANDAAAATHSLEEIPVVELFREGYAEAAELQNRVRRLTLEGWASTHPRALELLDPPLRDQVGALLDGRPRFFEIAEDGETGLIREFATPREIADTRVALEMAEDVGELLVGQLGLDVARVLAAVEMPAFGSVRFGAIFGTLLAWHATRGELRGDPLPADVMADFLRTVASRRTAGPDAPARALANLLQTLNSRFDLGPRRTSVLQAFGRFCLVRIAEECASLDPGTPVDPSLMTSLQVRD